MYLVGHIEDIHIYIRFGFRTHLFVGGRVQPQGHRADARTILLPDLQGFGRPASPRKMSRTSKEDLGKSAARGQRARQRCCGNLVNSAPSPPPPNLITITRSRVHVDGLVTVQRHGGETCRDGDFSMRHYTRFFPRTTASENRELAYTG